MKTIAVYNAKGGVGKSAVTIFLAEFLAAAEGARVLLIDLDPRQSSSIGLLGEPRLHAALENGTTVERLLRARLKSNLSADEVRSFIVPRPGHSGSGSFKFLKTLHVLAPDREGWHDLNEDLIRYRQRGQNSFDELLCDAIAPIQNDYDLCLIDFPAHDRGPIVRAGLRASSYWLLPVVPDRMSIRDLDSSRALFRTIVGDHHKIRGLGTLLNICQNRAGGEYRNTRQALNHLAASRFIPKLFSPESEIAFSTDVKNALDDTHLAQTRTLAQRLGGTTTSGLYMSVRKLTSEVLQRLKLAAAKEREEMANETPVNPLVTSIWK